MQTVTFRLQPIPPYRLDFTVWAIRRRAGNSWDRWDGRAYRRVLALGQRAVEVAVTQDGPPENPALEVTATGDALGPDAREAIMPALERLLGMGIDLDGFFRLAGADPRLGPLAGRFRGFKPPRYPSLFEALVNGIACQQMTLTFGIQLLSDLVARYGLAYRTPEGEVRAFPRPEDLAKADPADLRAMRFSGQKARALLELAQGVSEGSIDLGGLEVMDDAAALERLCRLRGVGRWTAEYVMLRGLGRLNVFPGDDAGARNNLLRWLGLAGPANYETVERLVQPWQPYAGLVYFHLLLDRIAASGHLA